MAVESILKNKRNVVFTTGPDTTIGAIVGAFGQNEAGSLVVVDHSDMVVGLLTERDILIVLGGHGAAALSLPVLEVMASVKFRCHLQDTLARVMELMVRGKTRYLPVTKNGRLVGVISMTDMIMAHLSQKQDDLNWMRDYICADYSISYRHED